MKHTRHVEPDGGYGFGNKAKYRREKWSFVNEALKNIAPIRNRRVLLLETEEFNEVECLLARGYSPRNIHVVNKAWVSGADRAWATRRLEARFGCRLTIHGCEFAEAIQETSEQLIDVYDYDGTGTVETTQPVLNLTAEYSGSRRHVTVVTVFAGREQTSFWCGLLEKLSKKTFTIRPGTVYGIGHGHIVQGMTEGHMARTDTLLMSMCQASEDFDSDCTSHVCKMRVGKYLNSSGKPMLWAGALVEPHSPVKNEHLVRCVSGDGEEGSAGAGAFLYMLTSRPITPWCIYRDGVAWAADNPDRAQALFKAVYEVFAQNIPAHLRQAQHLQPPVFGPPQTTRPPRL